MKRLGKRILSMGLAFGLTASMLISDLSVMQVNAAGNASYVVNGENVTVEQVIEERNEEKSSVDIVMEAMTEENSSENAQDETTPSESIPEGSSGETTPPTSSSEESDGEITPPTSSSEEDDGETTPLTSSSEESDGETTPPTSSSEEPTSEEEIIPGGFRLEANEDGELTVKFSKGVEKLFGAIEIPATVKSIPKNAKYFYDNDAITSVTFANGSVLERIEEEAFFRTTIKEIKIPSTVTFIGSNAFSSSSLEKVTLVADGAGITLGNNAFSHNYYLTTFVTNGRLKEIGKSAFAENKTLKSFVKTAGSSTGDDYALQGTESIAESAFSGCSALAYIKIPVKKIEANTFKNCTSLGTGSGFYAGARAVEFDTGVEEIGDSAFYGCTGLEEVILPENIKKLGNNVFDGCKALKSIQIDNQDSENPGEACAIELTYTSFPCRKGLVLKAYNGTVKDWVGTHALYEVEFETLYEAHTISYSKSIKNGTIKANVSKARAGETVTVSATPDEGYVLEHGSLYYVESGGNRSGKIDAWEYTFIMPDYAVEIYGMFVKLEDLKYGDELVLSDDDLLDRSSENITYSKEKNTLEFPKPWQSVRIRVTGNNKEIPGYSELKYESANTKIVTIDERGNMRALASGETKITVSLLDESKKVKPLVITVKVGAKTYVRNLTFSYEAPKASVAYATDENNYDVITLPASKLNIEAYTFNVVFNGIDEEGDKLDVTYLLESNDKSVAKPKASRAVGSSEIVIPKGAVGETVIGVTPQDGAEESVKKLFIVRVIDDTPRLADSTITVDPQSDIGTLLELISVYNAELDARNLSIKEKKVKDGTTYWEDTSGIFRLNVIDGKVYLQALESDENQYTKGEKYTFKDKYYIVNDSGNEGRFYIAIPSLVIYKKDISLKMQVSGKINLFYNGIADVSKTGSVTVKPKSTKTDLKIAKCELEGSEKTNGTNRDDDYKFAENFDASLDVEKQVITITRADGATELSCYSAGKSEGKPVVSGVLKIWYEGYGEEYCDEIPLNIPTHTTAPSYKLSTTKVTLNTNASGQHYELSLINTKTKKVEDLTEDTIVKIDFSATPYELVKHENGNVAVDAKNDKVLLDFAVVQKSKVVLIVSQPDWEDQSGWNSKNSIKVTLTVATTSKAPTAKLGKTTVTVNKQCPDAKATTTMTLNQEDFVLTENQEFIAVDENKSKNLIVTYEDGIVIAEIIGEVKKGTHKFTCNPKYTWKTASDDVESQLANKITINVKVDDTNPSLKLKSATFTVNADAPMWEDNKYDFMTRTFTWLNLPAEYSDYVVSTDNMELVYKGKNSDPLKGEGVVHFEIDGETKTATAYLEYATKLAGKSSYTVQGVELVNETTGSRVEVKPFIITINSVNKTPTVTLTAKGTLNPLDSESMIVYTPKLSNINGTLDGVKIMELADSGALLPEGTEHFEVLLSEDGKIALKVKEGETLENRTYTIQIYYSLSNAQTANGWYMVSKVQKIKPKQTMPKLSLDKKNLTFYAGNTDRTQTITVTKNSQSTANINDVIFSSKTSEILQNAFSIDFDPNTGKMELKLKNSAFIKQGQEQTLTFEIVCDGQLKNTQGTTFTVEVKVIK